MALKSYILTQDHKAPYVVATGLPHKPQKVGFKKYAKGDIIKGELKHANGKPAFVLVSGVCVVPLGVIKELVTKNVVSHEDSQVSSADGINQAESTKPQTKKLPKIKYVDAMLIGGLVGFIGVHVAQKQNWIQNTDNKVKLYGTLAGVALGAYFVYRFANPKAKSTSKVILKDKE